MKVAVTIWENRISPVFDSARQLLLVKIDNGGVISEQIRCLVEGSPYTTLLRLQAEEDVEFLLCGAICKDGVRRLQAGGLELIPFLSGEVDGVLARFAAGKALERFAMPGCRWQCCCRRRAERICSGRKRRQGYTLS